MSPVTLISTKPPTRKSVPDHVVRTCRRSQRMEHLVPGPEEIPMPLGTRPMLKATVVLNSLQFA